MMEKDRFPLQFTLTKVGVGMTEGRMGMTQIEKRGMDNSFCTSKKRRE